jgi:hypothetical protein
MVKNSINLPTETETGRHRISADTRAWVVPSNRAASVWVSFLSSRI